MNEIITKENIKIEDMIFEVRGKQVMMDSDLAKLYKCTNGTKDINKSVSRNKEKFPDDFCFQITKEEYEEHLRFHYGTLKTNRGEHRKYLPHVFTEEGVAMLSSVLKTEIASKMSVSIIKAFVSMRKYISKELLDVLSKINREVIIYTKNIDNTLINKYQSQCDNLIIKITNKFHDRFIIIDDNTLYHSGASFKDLGKKCFAINKIEDKSILKELKSKL